MDTLEGCLSVLSSDLLKDFIECTSPMLDSMCVLSSDNLDHEFYYSLSYIHRKVYECYSRRDDIKLLDFDRYEND